MTRIQIGYEIENKSPIYFNLDREGVCKVLGMTRSGKTCNVMNISIQASKHRQVIIFSYGDEYDKMIFANPMSLKPDSLDASKTTLISGVKLKISDLDKLEYWRYLVSEGAARFAWDLSRKYEYHQDIPEQFFKIVAETHTSSKYTQDDTTLNEMSKQSLLTAKPVIMELLDIESNDWQALVQSGNHLIINLNLSQEDKWKAQFLVGYILRVIKPVIHKTKPLIIFEEADILLEFEEGKTFSFVEITDYNLKMQKAGIYMILISQQDYRMPRTVNDNCTKHIYGKFPMTGDSYLSSQVNSIRWEHHNNYREFVYFDVASGFIKKYNPVDVPCYVNRR